MGSTAMTAAQQAQSSTRVDSLPMEERKDPRFVQFSEGDVVEGVLINIERIRVKGKLATRFAVMEGDTPFGKFVASGETVTFLGTYQLESKLRTDDLGKFVSVRCEGSNAGVVGPDRNPMKLFKVMVSKKNVLEIAAMRESDVPEITDADIPF